MWNKKMSPAWASGTKNVAFLYYFLDKANPSLFTAALEVNKAFRHVETLYQAGLLLVGGN